MYTLAPFFKYCSATRQSPSLKITTECHSVFSRRSPEALSRQVSVVASRRLAIGRPSCVRRISGSLPRLPTKITLLTEPAMLGLLHICQRPPPRAMAADSFKPTLAAAAASRAGPSCLSPANAADSCVPVTFLYRPSRSNAQESVVLLRGRGRRG